MSMQAGFHRVIIAVGAFAVTAAAQPNVAAWDVLKRGLSETNPDKRKQAVLAVGTIGPAKEVIEILNEALRDKEIFIRQSAAAEIGDAKIRQCIPNLIAALNDTGEVAFTAARALWDMGDHTGRDVFQDVLTGELKDQTGFIQGAVRDARAKMRNPRSLARMGLMEASGALLGPFSMGITLASDAMKDTGAVTRALSVMTISQDCNARGVQLMEWSMATDKSNLVRAAAARALGRCGNLSSISKLMMLLPDNSEAVRYMAGAAIVRLSIEKSPKPDAPAKPDAAAKPDSTPTPTTEGSVESAAPPTP